MSSQAYVATWLLRRSYNRPSHPIWLRCSQQGKVNDHEVQEILSVPVYLSNIRMYVYVPANTKEGIDKKGRTLLVR